MSQPTLNQYHLALEMLAYKARISIVAKATGLTPAILRREYVRMHQRSPSCGSMKTTPQFFFKKFSRHKEATLFAFFYSLESEPNMCTKLINAYKRYTAYIKAVWHDEPLIDFSDAWFISGWHDSGDLRLVRCSNCHSVKLVNKDHNLCCVCHQ